MKDSKFRKLNEVLEHIILIELNRKLMKNSLVTYSTLIYLKTIFNKPNSLKPIFIRVEVQYIRLDPKMFQ